MRWGTVKVSANDGPHEDSIDWCHLCPEHLGALANLLEMELIRGE
jgi:hypothetical protein